MVVQRAGAAWLGRVASESGPIYAGIVRALEAAIREGELQPGDRLPAQRQVAEQLGVDLTTVTRAYAAAHAQGLLDGAVGRGTFVRLRAEEDDAGLIDLSMNLPPPPEGLSLGALLRDSIDAILARTDPARLMAYHPGFGTLGQRRAGAAWLAPCLGERAPETVLVSPGAQAALAATLSTLCKAGDAVVAEPLTYPGFRAVADQFGLRAIACPVDQHGPIPAALADICARERPAAVYLTPTMQNPTARTTPAPRRRALARIIEAAGAWLVEDDPYSRLLEAPPPALATFLPARWVYIGTLSKTLSPGLRVAYAVCATGADAARIAAGLRAVALTTSPVMAAVATTWIREGRAEALLAAVRAEARARRALAAQLLPTAEGSPESLHVWLPLPAAVSPEHIRAAAEARGLALVTQDAFQVGPAAEPGMRISLGGPGRRAVLADALQRLAETLAGPVGPRPVV